MAPLFTQTRFISLEGLHGRKSTFSILRFQKCRRTLILVNLFSVGCSERTSVLGVEELLIKHFSGQVHAQMVNRLVDRLQLSFRLSQGTRSRQAAFKNPVARMNVLHFGQTHLMQQFVPVLRLRLMIAVLTLALAPLSSPLILEDLL